MATNDQNDKSVNTQDEIRDEVLWKKAKRRASFRYHALIYFIINIFFWTMYYISLRSSDVPAFDRNPVPWPVWPMMGWGIGLIFHYVSAYSRSDILAEKEYEKLKNKNNLK
jgi:hypothetical protein